jgi:hypothetical protein
VPQAAGQPGARVGGRSVGTYPNVDILGSLAIYSYLALTNLEYIRGETLQQFDLSPRHHAHIEQSLDYFRASRLQVGD